MLALRHPDSPSCVHHDDWTNDAFEEVLGRMAAGRPPLPGSTVHTLANGQVAVVAFPITWAEKTLDSSMVAPRWVITWRITRMWTACT